MTTAIKKSVDNAFNMAHTKISETNMNKFMKCPCGRLWLTGRHEDDEEDDDNEDEELCMVV